MTVAILGAIFLVQFGSFAGAFGSVFWKVKNVEQF